MVRPLRYLLDKQYELTPDLDLLRLPLDAIEGVSSSDATKLTSAGVNSISELAEASVERLTTEGLAEKEIVKAISYAKDVVTHAQTPGVQEGLMPLEEMLDKAYESTPPDKLASLGPDAIQGLSKGDAKKIADIASTIQALAGTNAATLKDAGFNDYEAQKFSHFARMIMQYTRGVAPGEVKVLNLLVYGAIGGIVGGIVYSLVMMLGGMFPIIGQMLGFAAPMDFLVGVVMHLIASIIFGLAYGVIIILLLKYISFIDWDLSDWIKNIILGLIYGFAVWIFGPIIVMPIMMTMGGMSMTMDPMMALVILIGHFVFGAIISVIVVFSHQKFEVTPDLGSSRLPLDAIEGV